MANAKKFNLQSIAINKFITITNKKGFIKELDSDLEEFNELYNPYRSRDIVFKNNSLLTRNSVLISPAHYFYYTKLVFDIVMDSCENNELHYKSDEIHAYYSGVLFDTINVIEDPKQILFNNSYNQFQNELLINEGKQAIEIDLSNFFDSISKDDLIAILYEKYDKEKVQRLNTFFECMEMVTLPQLHYSIASSIMSQEYLSNFDNDIKNVLKENRFKMIRFVDDMFLFNNDIDLEEPKFHIILDKINNILWKNKLNLNSKKVELYINKRFSRELSEAAHNSSGNYSFISEKRIEDKSNTLVNDIFIEFIKEVNTLNKFKGYNVGDFSELFESTFSIGKDNDSRKVINNFVYGKKWTSLKEADLKYIMLNYQFVFYLPDIFLPLYLMIYEFVERKEGRDEYTIRQLLRRINNNSGESLRYLYSSLNYLIQRNFKKVEFINEVTDTEEKLGGFIRKYITI